MKKSILFFAIALFSTSCFAQRIGIKLPKKQDIIIIPAQDAITTSADTISVNEIRDNGSCVSVFLLIGTKGDICRARMLVLWEGDEYKKNQNWTNDTIIARIKVLLNLK